MSLNNPGGVLARARDRAEYALFFAELAVHAPDHTAPDPGFSIIYPLVGNDDDRKAEADRVAAEIGAVTSYRNGRYCASGTLGAFYLELWFSPAIRQPENGMT